MAGRTHHRGFKLLIVRQLSSGEKRPAQVCREHNLAASMVSRGPREYAERAEAAFSPKEPSEIEALQAKVGELERFCGQLSWEDTVLKRALQRLPSKLDTR